MFFWRKRNEGFEWQPHEPTVVREKRAVRAAKVDAVKQAVGAKLEHPAALYGGQLQLLWVRMVYGARYLWLYFRYCLAWLIVGIADVIGWVADALMHEPVRRFVGFIGVLWGLAGLVHAFNHGFDPATRASFIAAVLIAAFALVPLPKHWTQGMRSGATQMVKSARTRLTRLVADSPTRQLSRLLKPPRANPDPPKARALSLPRIDWSTLPRLSVLPFRTLGAIAALIALITGSVLLFQQVEPVLRTTFKSEKPAAAGKAVATSSDLIRVDATEVRLFGIEAPELEQRCGEADGRGTWRCGRATQGTLASLVKGKDVRCMRRAADPGGRIVAQCFEGKRDLAAHLVREGLAWAAKGDPAGYGKQEAAAKEDKAGVWRGAAERPSEYRAKLWESAKKKAPDGCPIKGSVTAQGKTYYLPWSPAYERIKVERKRGSRWFCSEEEAIAAGWRAGAG